MGVVRFQRPGPRSRSLRRPRWRALRRSELALALAAVLLGVVAVFASPQGAGPAAEAARPEPAAPSNSFFPRGQIRVIDGDTVEIVATRERVRLANIDAAELGEGAACAAERRHGEAAKSRARAVVARSRQVVLQRTGRVDGYGRTIGYLLVDGEDLGRRLIEAGLARPWRGRREPWCDARGALAP